MDDILLKNIDKLGAMFTLALAVTAFVRGWIVPGYIYTKTQADCERMTQLAFRNVELAERSVTVAEKLKG